MKKIISLLVLAAVLMTMSACKKTPKPDANETSGVESAASPNEQNKASTETGNKSDAVDLQKQNNTDTANSQNNADTTVSSGNFDPGVSSGNSGSANSDEGKVFSSVHISYAHIPHAQRVEQTDLVMICRYDGKAVQVEPDETSPGQYANKVYTDQYVTPIKIAKGNATGSVPVRVIGGEKDNMIYSSSEPTLTKGKSYLLYLKKGTSIRQNDVDHYKMFGGYQCCVPINDDGTLDLTYVDANEKELVTEYYNSIK